MVYDLRFYEGFSFREISGKLNIKVGTVKSLYHRAIRNMTAEMEEANKPKIGNLVYLEDYRES